jgi:transposase
MKQQDAFALGRSTLNGVLFADIGVERSGMPLSVISALARQGLNPWHEAGRLAKLPGTTATDELARLIATIDAVRNAILEPCSNRQVEGQVNRLKTLKRAMYGRASVELLRARMMPLDCAFHTE